MLGEVVPTFEKFVRHWKRMSEVVPRCGPFIRPGLQCIAKYNHNDD